jgi:amidase
MPSNRAALYSIKPTPGLISNNGLVPVSTLFDVPGPMAKTAEDLGILMDALVSRPNDKEPNKYLSSSQNKSWQDLRVGVLDPEVWQQPAFMIKPDAGATKQMITEIKIAYETIRPLTKAFHENIELHFPTTEDRTALAALHSKLKMSISNI